MPKPNVIEDDPFFAKLAKKKKSRPKAEGVRVTKIAKGFENCEEAEKRIESNSSKSQASSRRANVAEKKEFYEKEIAERAKKTEVIKGKARVFRRGRRNKQKRRATEALAVAGIDPEDNSVRECTGEIGSKDDVERKDEERHDEALVTGAILGAGAAAAVDEDELQPEEGANMDLTDDIPGEEKGKAAAADIMGEENAADQLDQLDAEDAKEIETDQLDAEEKDDVEAILPDQKEMETHQIDAGDQKETEMNQLDAEESDDVEAIVGDTVADIVAQENDQTDAKIGASKLKKTYWRERVDPKTGKMYYYNKKTKKVQWARPDDEFKPVKKDGAENNVGVRSRERKAKKAGDRKKASSKTEAKKPSTQTIKVSEKPFGMISGGQLVINVWGDAEKAGLAVGDRLTRIKGKKFKSQKEMKTLLSKAVLPYEIEYLPGDVNSILKAQKLQVKAELKLFRAGDPELEERVEKKNKFGRKQTRYLKLYKYNLYYAHSVEELNTHRKLDKLEKEFKDSRSMKLAKKKKIKRKNVVIVPVKTITSLERTGFGFTVTSGVGSLSRQYTFEVDQDSERFYKQWSEAIELSREMLSKHMVAL